MSLMIASAAEFISKIPSTTNYHNKYSYTSRHTINLDHIYRTPQTRRTNTSATMVAKTNTRAISKVEITPHKKEADTTNVTYTPTEAMATSADTSTTRICVKNLPQSFDEFKLKNHLQTSIHPSQSSLVLTDCKVLKTKDGRSRKIAFVGFKTPEVRGICTRDVYAL